MMRSATAFLPPSMITFMNLDNSTLPNLGSGRISRLGTSRRRGIFSPLNCFSWRLATPQKPFGFYLLDPQRVTTLHPRATRETTPFFRRSRALLGLWLFRAVFGARLLAIFHA